MEQLRDFEINLLAGLLILLLEAALFAFLLPYAIDWRNRKRWRGPRQEFVRSLLAELQPIVNRLATRAKRLYEETPPEGVADLNRWEAEAYDPFFAPATTSLEALLRRLPDELPIYAVSLTPDAHRHFVAWRSALVAFHAALRDLHVIGWTHIRAVPQPERFRSGEAFADVIKRFEELDRASGRLLESAGLGKDHDLGHRTVSLRPSDNFEPADWAGAATAMGMVAQDRKLANRGL
jgi:hypothetical protein